MSKPWHVLIEPKQLHMAPAPHFLKPKKVDVDALSVLATGDGLVTAHLNALNSYVTKHQIKKLHVTLSNAYVKYLVVPWRDDLPTKATRDAFLNYLFVDHFGEESQQWFLRQQTPAYQQNVIASGIHQRLINELRVWATEHQLVLAAIKPSLVVAANAAIDYAAQHHFQNYWLAVIDGDRLCLLFCFNQQWKAIQQVAVSASIADQISAMIHREHVVFSLDATVDWPLLVYSTHEHVQIMLTERQVHTISSSITQFYS
jgi:hypothetical protein